MDRRYREFDEGRISFGEEGRTASSYEGRGRWRDLPDERPAYSRYDRETTRQRVRDEYDRPYDDYEASYADYRSRGAASLGRRRDHDNWGTAGSPYETYGQGRGPLRSHLRCRDIMTSAVITGNKQMPIRQIARMMREEDAGAIPLVSVDATLEGIVTDRDIVVRGLTSDKGDSELKAEDCMSSDIYAAHPNDRVVDVLEDMADNQVRRIPIVDARNRLVGIVSMADIAIEAGRDRELANALERISKPSSWLDRIANFFRRW